MIARWNVVDALAADLKQIDKSPYAYCWNNPVLLTDPDGNCPDHECDGSCRSMTSSVGFIGKDISEGIKKLPSQLLTFTDVNDATVLVTTLTRVSEAINVDETEASGLDIGLAIAGAALPMVSGSAVKKGLEFIGEHLIGAYKALQGKVADAHHIFQDAAVRELAGYKKGDAPAIHLDGPSNVKGTPHNLATTMQQQRRAIGDGGTFGSERNIAYRSLRAAGLSPENAKRAVQMSGAYFSNLGVTVNTPTRIPNTRK